MHVEKKRIFVGNLPPYVEENDIRKQFSNYGKVVSVDIKQRKVNADENVSPVFAFVNVEIENRSLQKCFQEISNYNWQGYYVNLELAKESFLDRLKREREEAQAQNSKNNSSKSEQQLSVPSVPPVNNVNQKVYNSDTDDDSKLKPKQNGTATSSKIISKKKETSSSSSSSSESDSDDKPKSKQNNSVTPAKPVSKGSKRKESSSSSSSDSDRSDEKSKQVQKNKPPVAEENEDDGIKLVIKSNKHKINKNGGLKIESVNSTPIHVITKKGVKNEQKDPKFLEADEKRKQSLIQMKNAYNQQKFAIRNALSKIDTKQNKTTFDEAGHSINKRNHDENNHSSSKKQKLSLFEDDGDEYQSENINFSVKSQFEGRQGQKLLALQSRFTNDKRFALDQRFADDEEEYEMEAVGDDEKEKQLEILESVLGQKIRKDFRGETKTSNMPRGMLRFDPSKPEHSKFEIKRDEYSKKDKRKEKKEKELDKVEEAPIPEVSKETFYQVKTNLKESLKDTEGFSLLSMFGRTEEKSKDDKAEYEPAEEIKKNKQFDYNKNPFKYDSSDTEDDQPNKQKNKYNQKKEKTVEPRSAFKWSESFFFETNDSRLKDGLAFLRNIKNIGKFESFKDKRRAVFGVIRGKVKHIERDHQKKMFRKKLSKRIKVKKANRS